MLEHVFKFFYFILIIFGKFENGFRNIPFSEVDANNKPFIPALTDWYPVETEFIVS
jgi:hypothetical protein